MRKRDGHVTWSATTEHVTRVLRGTNTDHDDFPRDARQLIWRPSACDSQFFVVGQPFAAAQVITNFWVDKTTRAER